MAVGNQNVLAVIQKPLLMAQSVIFITSQFHWHKWDKCDQNKALPIWSLLKNALSLANVMHMNVGVQSTITSLSTSSTVMVSITVWYFSVMIGALIAHMLPIMKLFAIQIWLILDLKVLILLKVDNESRNLHVSMNQDGRAYMISVEIFEPFPKIA